MATARRCGTISGARGLRKLKETKWEESKFSYFVYTGDNGIDVIVPVESIRTISERFANTAYGFSSWKEGWPTLFSSDGLNSMLENGPWFIRNNPLILKEWHSDVNTLKEDVGSIPVWVKLHGVPVTASVSSYARAMIELRADMELKDNIVAAMPKINDEDNIMFHVEKKTSQAPKGIPVGQKMGFKPKQVYQPVSKKSTTSNRGNKNKNVESTDEVSKSNSFDALNLVDNDVEMGTNGGSTYLASQEANSSGSSFWNTKSSSPSTTPLMDKTNKMENLIIDGKAILVDNERKPLSKVDEDSEDEVASVDNDMANFLAKNDGYGTQSLLKQWKDSHELDDYVYDPYDDDLYEGQEIPETLQAFCDHLDIKVRGRKKK
ncbi:pyruvate, phosphate dikinase, chloroplastic [Tanacetum coccineum]